MPRLGAEDVPWHALQPVEHAFYARADNGTDKTSPSKTGMSSSTKVAVIVVVIVAVFIVVALGLFIFIRRRRSKAHTYSPPSSLKNRWRTWGRTKSSGRGRYSDRLQPDSSLPSLHPGPRGVRGSRGNSRTASPALEQLRTRDSASVNESMTAGASVVDRDVESGQQGTGTRGTPAGNQEAVDRHTSVRSIMTLPMYSAAPGETEQVLGREGERAGIDVVLEYPETNDDVEERREAEMESLYQIRRARRAEAAEREERRQLRREARARGDWAEVERLRVEARQAQERRERELQGEDPQGAASAARLIAEHQEEQQRRERQRRVSSVQYAELGVARHDGSRVRASSNASARSDDNRPLLDAAAPMAAEPGSERRGTLSTLGETLGVHHRNRSASSVLSFSSAGSADDDNTSMYHPPFAPPPIDLPRGRSTTVATAGSSPDFEVVSLHSDAGDARSATATPRPHSRAASMSNLAQSSSASDFHAQTQAEHPARPSTPSLHTTYSRGESMEMADTVPRSGSAASSHPHLLETPVEAPPHYEHLAGTTFGEPPIYESPVEPRGPHLPPLERLPSIRVSESHGPDEGPEAAARADT